MSEHSEGLRNRVFCSSCGTAGPRRGGVVSLGWQEMSDASGREIVLCPECVRRNLWLIEARFDVDPGAGF